MIGHGGGALLHQQPDKLPKKPRSGLPTIALILRHRLVQKALSPLEKATRDAPHPPDGTKAVVAESLTRPLLEDFFSNRILAIHIPGWYDSTLCAFSRNDPQGEVASNTR